MKKVFKTQVERDHLWLSCNNVLMFPTVIWSIIVDYYSDDPKIIDLICQNQKESFTVAGEMCENGQMPDSFLISINNYAYDCIEINVNHFNILWSASNIDLFQILLLMPTDPESSDTNILDGISDTDIPDDFEYVHLPLIRDYLYWRLAHPEIPANTE